MTDTAAPPELDHRRNVSPDVDRDHATVREQLVGRRDEAERRRASAASDAERAQRQASEWSLQVERYDALLAALGTTAPDGA